MTTDANRRQAARAPRSTTDGNPRRRPQRRTEGSVAGPRTGGPQPCPHGGAFCWAPQLPRQSPRSQRTADPAVPVPRMTPGLPATQSQSDKTETKPQRPSWQTTRPGPAAHPQHPFPGGPGKPCRPRGPCDGCHRHPDSPSARFPQSEPYRVTSDTRAHLSAQTGTERRGPATWSVRLAGHRTGEEKKGPHAHPGVCSGMRLRKGWSPRPVWGGDSE